MIEHTRGQKQIILHPGVLHYLQSRSPGLKPFRRSRESAIRARNMLAITYKDEKGRGTSRQIRPLALAYFAPVEFQFFTSVESCEDFFMCTTFTGWAVSH